MSRFGKMVLGTAALAAAVGLGYGVGLTDAWQPHMQNALGDLQAAQHQLQVALRNKGGHRVAALNFVNQAITEVQAGIACGDRDC